MRNFVLAAVFIAFGSLPALARTPQPSYWYPTRPGLTQQAFEADKGRCALLSLAMAAAPQAAAISTLFICMEDRGWAPGRGNGSIGRS